MNDPDRRRAFDGFDDDAIFADIVAHLNDDEAPVDRATPPLLKDATAEVADVEVDVEPPEPTGETAIDPTDLPPGQTSRGDGQRRDPGQWLAGPPPMPPTDGGPPVVPAPLVWRAHEVDAEDEEHFEPPPVTPLPAGDLTFYAIIAGMAGGPLLLLYLVFFNRNASSYWILAAIAMSVGGFALLVSRMPGNHDEDDDGARL